MRQSTRRLAIGVVLAVAAVTITTTLFAASKETQLIWEGEAVKNLSGKAFEIKKLTDSSGKVSDKKVLGTPKVEKGKKATEGSVTYKVQIKTKGTYYLWARVRWTSGCGNSFGLEIPDLKTKDLTLGGDSTYDSLHWINLKDGSKPRRLSLKKSTVEFVLKAKEAGAMVDQFLLTTDKDYHPAGIYDATKDLLED